MEGMANIIAEQWFGKGKANVKAYKEMAAARYIPGPVIILVITAVSQLPSYVYMLSVPSGGACAS